MTDDSAARSLGRRRTDPVRRSLRVTFWVLLVVTAALGLIGSLLKGPGLLVAAVVLSLGDVVLHRHIPNRGYELLILGLVVVVAAWWAPAFL